MPTQYGSISVSTSAVEIIAAQANRRGAFIRNNDDTLTVYLGMDDAVTSSNGIPLRAGEIMNIAGQRENWRGSVWGVTASGSVDVRFWEWTD